jgi:2TM domain
MTTSDDTAYREARERVRALRAFYQHLIVYAAVMCMLLLINLTTSANWWVQWPIMGWGLLLVLHGVFTNTGLLGSAWEERRIAELMRKREGTH